MGCRLMRRYLVPLLLGLALAYGASFGTTYSLSDLYGPVTEILEGITL